MPGSGARWHPMPRRPLVYGRTTSRAGMRRRSEHRRLAMPSASLARHALRGLDLVSRRKPSASACSARSARATAGGVVLQGTRPVRIARRIKAPPGVRRMAATLDGEQQQFASRAGHAAARVRWRGRRSPALLEHPPPSTAESGHRCAVTRAIARRHEAAANRSVFPDRAFAERPRRRCRAGSAWPPPGTLSRSASANRRAPGRRLREPPGRETQFIASQFEPVEVPRQRCTAARRRRSEHAVVDRQFVEGNRGVERRRRHRARRRRRAITPGLQAAASRETQAGPLQARREELRCRPARRGRQPGAPPAPPGRGAGPFRRGGRVPSRRCRRAAT